MPPLAYASLSTSWSIRGRFVPWWQVKHCTFTGGLPRSSSALRYFSFRSRVISIIARAVFFSGLSSSAKSSPWLPSFRAAWQALHRTPSARANCPIVARSSSCEMSLGSTFRFVNFSCACAVAPWNVASTPPASKQAARTPYGVTCDERFIDPPVVPKRSRPRRWPSVRARWREAHVERRPHAIAGGRGGIGVGPPCFRRHPGRRGHGQRQHPRQLRERGVGAGTDAAAKPHRLHLLRDPGPADLEMNVREPPGPLARGGARVGVGAPRRSASNGRSRPAGRRGSPRREPGSSPAARAAFP